MCTASTTSSVTSASHAACCPIGWPGSWISESSESRSYQEPGERARNEYRLTRKGVDLLPVMVSLMSWGDRHVNGDDGPVHRHLHDRQSGEIVNLELRTPSGRVVAPNEMEPRVRR